MNLHWAGSKNAEIENDAVTFQCVQNGSLNWTPSKQISHFMPPCWGHVVPAAPRASNKGGIQHKQLRSQHRTWDDADKCPTPFVHKHWLSTQEPQRPVM